MNIIHKLFQRFQRDRITPIGIQIHGVAIEGFRPTNLHWAELDILRGIAAALMIVNHLGYKTLNSEHLRDGLTSHLVFIGSFAPVLFFFITGVGYGIQSKKPQKPNHWAILLNKVAILILADLFMHWSNGQWLGLDFFGFIGISCIVLELLRSSQYSIIYALSGLIIISSLRYGIGPHLNVNGSLGYGGEFWGWLLGTSSPTGVSYALSPWLVYPLLGYIVGWGAGHYAEIIKQRWQPVSLGLSIFAILPLTAGMILANKGFAFFRWGTVSLSYYIVSFAAIAIALVGAILICQMHLLQIFENPLSLPGVASFAIVPIHYFLIYLFDWINPEKLSPLSFSGVAIVVLVVSFLIAKLVNQCVIYNQSLRNQKLIYWSLVGIVVMSGIVAFNLNQQNLSVTMLARTLGQTTLCLLFAIRRG